MVRKQKLLFIVVGLVGLAVIASGCEISFPWADCSGINQPDMGGLTCLGLNAISLQAVLALLALVLGAAFGGGA